MSIPNEILSRFPNLSDAEMSRLLEPPTGPVRMILDTDTHNEIDDQFALAWTLLSPEQIKLEGVCAEPYSFQHHRPGLLMAHHAIERGGPTNEEETKAVNQYSSWVKGLLDVGTDPHDVTFVPPDVGMEKSYEEILTVYEKLEMDPAGMAFRGSPGYLSSLDAPIQSESVELIIERALAQDDQPLYLSAIGCVTNIASALLIAPEIIKNIVVLWTAGYPSRSHRSNRPALNLVQDRLASQLLFACGVPLIYLPGYYIGAQLRLSLPEMETWVRGKGKIGDYLYWLYTHNPIHAQRGVNGHFGRSWVIWDMINIAWLIDPDWVPTDMMRSPLLGDDLLWHHPEDVQQHLMREAFDINRDAIFRDFFAKLDHAP